MLKRYGFILLMLLGVAVTPAFAKDDRVSFASDITVEDGSTSGDLVFLLCSVKVHGQVHGDVVAILGSVSVDDQRSISGDLVAVGGDASLGNQASVHGDVAVVAGDLTRASDATIGGELSVVQGRGWLLLPLAPLIIFIGIVWLIVWFVQRNRYQFPMYPQGRGF